MTRRRFALWALPAASALLTLSFGCQGGRPSPGGAGSPSAGAGPSGAGTTLVFWHTQTQQNKVALEDLCRRFNEQNGKGITVRPLYQGDYTQLYQKIINAITAHSLPDIAVSYESMVADYMKASAVVPLDSYVKGPDGLSPADLDDIFPAFLATNRYPQFGNQLLSFPFTKSLLVNYVNMDALKRAGFRDAPRTWAEFADASVKMTHPAQGSLPAMKGLAVDVNPSTIDGWIMAQGGTLYDSAGAHFTTPAAHAVFAGLSDLFKKGAAYQTRGFDYQSDFGAQRAGMVCTSSTQRDLFRPLINNKFQWKLAMIPQKDPAHPVTVLYGANICIFKSTPEKQRAAWEFLRWLSLRDQAAYWAIHSSYMPLRKSVAALPEMQAAWKTDPQGKQAFDLIKYARPEPNVRGWQEVRTALGDALQAVISGAKDPDAALKELDAKANQAIQAKKT